MSNKKVTTSAVLVTGILWCFAYFYGQMDFQNTYVKSNEVKAHTTYYAGFNALSNSKIKIR